MTNNVRYNQYFTPNGINSVLVSRCDIINPEFVIDFSSGDGSLLGEAMKKWPKTKLIANDIDASCLRILTNNLFPTITLNEDFLSINFLKKLMPYVNNIDVCIGNPPFELVQNNKYTKSILEAFNLGIYQNSIKIPAEIIFLLLAIKLTSPDGEIITILPEGLFVNSKWRYFRHFLITNYNVSILELPDKIFDKTEAKTHVLIIKKGQKPSPRIKISSIKFDDIYLSHEEATNRMDYQYYYVKNRFKNNLCDFFGHNDYQVIRGSRITPSHYEYDAFLHTTHLSDSFKIFKNDKKKTNVNTQNFKIAQEGDIIIPRVGTRAIGKVGYIEEGNFIISDCLFILRAYSSIIRQNLLKFLNSEDGKDWIISISKGVAAKHIAKEDLRQIPKTFIGGTKIGFA